MTISSPTFQRLQSGVVRADDLRVKEPVNAMMKWLNGDMLTQINAHFDAVSTSISAALVTLLSTANTWNAAQTTSLGASGTAQTFISSDAGAASGPDIILFRNSASPAAGDVIGSVQIIGKDGAGNNQLYAAIFGQIVDPGSTSEDSRMIVRTIGVGANRDWYFESGAFRHSTQTQPSNDGEIAAVAYKVGASQVVGARITGWGDPFGATSRATFSTTTATANQVAQALAALITDLKTHGIIGT